MNEARITISGRTAVVALLGDPLVQARAPGLMNAAFAVRGIDAVIVPWQTSPEALPAIVAAMRAIANLRGAIVTMPHKQAIIAHLDAVTPVAREVGACNVIRRDADGTLTGSVFDGEGFVAGLERAGYPVAGKRALLLGAGGAAAAIAFALTRHGVSALTVRNRTQSTGEALAARVAAARPGMDVDAAATPLDAFDLVVNASALGMRAGDPVPVDVAALRPDCCVADIVVATDVTPLLAAAQARGLRIHKGVAMIEAQLDLFLRFLFPP